MPVYSLIIFVAFRRLTSKEAGYVPANYVKEIEARTVKKATKQKVMVPEKVKVKRRVKKKVIVQKQRAVKVQKTPEKKGVWNCLVPHIFFFSNCWNKNKGQNEEESRQNVDSWIWNQNVSDLSCVQRFLIQSLEWIFFTQMNVLGLTEQCKLIWIRILLIE